MSMMTQRPDEITINLLPQDVRSKQKTQRWFQFALAGAITIVVILAAILVFYRLQIAHQEDVLREEQARAAQLRAQVEALRDIEILKATVDSGRLTLAAALAGDINWTKFLEDLDSTHPAEASLSSIAVASAVGTTALGEPSLGTVQYTGTVGSMPGLASWLDTMSEITGQRFVYLSNGSKDDAGVSFSASSHLTEEMVSGRCQEEGSKCP